MEPFFDHVMLSRLQFALATMFHILWPVTVIGLSCFLVVLEGLWMKTGDEIYLYHIRLWTRIFLLNAAIGLVSGIPLEFQFGTNWGLFSLAGGDFFGHILGFETSMAFMLEASFLGIMIFGWNRVSPRVHFFATCMVALGASLSAFWIMIANSWMHIPMGGFFADGQFVTESDFQAILNPGALWAFSHMWAACLEITLFVVGAVSAWYILKNRHVEFFLRSFKMALIAAIFVAPLQVFLGHGSGVVAHEHQPAKLAAMEAHWHTNPPGKGAALKLLAWPNKDKQDNDWALEIPNGLSLLITNSLTGEVKGLSEFPLEDQPPVAIPFYSLRAMIGIGFGLVAVMLWTVWAWHRGNLTSKRVVDQKRLLYAWIIAAPLSYVAMEAGWATREVGRQPWIIYNMMRTSEGASTLPPGAVASTLLMFIIAYTVLMVLFVVFGRRIIARGPDVELDPTSSP